MTGCGPEEDFFDNHIARVATRDIVRFTSRTQVFGLDFLVVYLVVEEDCNACSLSSFAAVVIIC